MHPRLVVGTSETPSKIHQSFERIPLMKDIERKLARCLSCANRTTVGKRRMGGFVPFKAEIRFHTVAA